MGGLNALIPLVFASFLIDLSGVNWTAAFFSILFIAITSTFLGLFISVPVSEVFEAQTFLNFFRFPMIFLCGLFLPIQNLPALIRPLSYILPLTYGADILKTSINGTGFISPLISFPVLLGFSLFLFLVSTRNIKKKWIY